MLARNHSEVVALLERHWEESTGITPSCRAMCRWFARGSMRGASIEARNEKSQTALHLAAENDHLEVVRPASSNAARTAMRSPNLVRRR